MVTACKSDAMLEYKRVVGQVVLHLLLTIGGVDLLPHFFGCMHRFSNLLEAGRLRCWVSLLELQRATLAPLHGVLLDEPPLFTLRRLAVGFLNYLLGLLGLDVAAVGEFDELSWNDHRRLLNAAPTRVHITVVCLVHPRLLLS